MLDEPERPALESYLEDRPRLVTSRLAIVEVTRAVKIASAGGGAEDEARDVLHGCVLIDVDEAIVGRAAELASLELRALDAIHLATAEAVAPDQLVTYDRRLLRASTTLGLRTASPGA